MKNQLSKSKQQTNNQIVVPKDNKGGSLKKKLLSSGGWALFTMFVWELVEEGLESLIALALSSALAIFVTKALSTLAIITATQGIKVCLKKFLLPFIKTITYKEGNDKVNKIKQFFTWIYANKKTLLGTISSAIMALSGTGVIDVSAMPALNIGSVNIVPIIYYVALTALALLGVTGKGFENIKTFFDRVSKLKAEKEDRAIIKEAEKEIANEKKLANQTQAEQDKALQKQKAEEEKAKALAEAEAQHRAKVEEAKAEILRKQNETENKTEAGV